MSKTERGDINKRYRVETGDLGPGAYDGGKQIGKDVIGYSWGQPKPEKVIIDPRDYGYDPEKEFKQTRHSSPSAFIKKTGKARMEFADKSKVDLGPGQYDDSKGFGSEVKGLTWRKPSPEKRVVDNRNYAVDPEKEFKQTRHRSPSAVITKDGAARPSTFADQSKKDFAGPGHYKTARNFGENAKSFTIGTKTETKIETSAGPGQYDAERSLSVTKSRSKAALIGKDKARPDTFANEAHVGTAGPGQYDDGVRFNSNVKSFKIGEKR